MRLLTVGGDASEVFRFQAGRPPRRVAARSRSRAGTTRARPRRGAARFVADALRAAPLAEIDPEDFSTSRCAARACARGRRRARDRVADLRASATARRADGRASSSSASAPSRTCAGALTASESLDARAQRCRVQRVVLLGAFLADVVYSRPVRRHRLRERRRDLLDALGARAVDATRDRPASSACSAERLRARRRRGREPLGRAAALHRARRRTRAARSRCVQKRQPTSRCPSTTRRCAAAAAEFEQRISALVAADPELTEYVRALKKREFAQ